MDQHTHSPALIPLVVAVIGVGLAVCLYLLIHKVINVRLGSHTDRQMLIGMEITVFGLLITSFVIDETFTIAHRFQSDHEGHPLTSLTSAVYLFGSFAASVLLYGAARHWFKRIASSGGNRTAKGKTLYS